LEASRLGIRIPHLQRLLREGAHATAVTSVLPSLTYPAHTTLVTGVAPARHGVVANRPFRTGLGEAAGWYWYAEDIRVPTLWDAARAAGLSTGAVDWPVTVGARITWNVAQFWSSEPDDPKLRRALSTPGLLADLESRLGSYPMGYAYGLEEDRRRTAFSVRLLRTRKPSLQLSYLSGLDEIQHTHGFGSPEALAALEEIDGLVGRLREAAEAAGGGQACVAVVSDHGFTTTTRELDLSEALRRAGLSATGDGVDGGRTMAWTAGGTAAVMMRDPADAATRVRLHRALEALARDPENGIAQVLTGTEARSAGGFPAAAFVVAMRPSFRVVDRVDGSLRRSGPPEGTHGHLPQEKAMDATFLVAGPRIPAGLDLGRIDMRDVAPTLAGLLGLEMPTAEGRDLLRSPETAVPQSRVARQVSPPPAAR
jgi:arylsulfatase A-like enzyme